MSRASVSQRWKQLRRDLERRGDESKLPEAATSELSRQYGLLDTTDRTEVDEVLSSWVLSDDLAERFDALAVISDNSVRSALPALRELSTRLERSQDPGAPYEWAKVNRIVGSLIEWTG